jgi:hypothetical protein
LEQRFGATFWSNVLEQRFGATFSTREVDEQRSSP